MDTSHGIDVSSFQGTQNWAALAKDGLTFAFAKASEGEHSRDSQFSAHMAGILAAGLVPGAYHYGWPVQDAAVEAANYIAAVKPYARTGFVHILDLERGPSNYGTRSAAQIRAWAMAWITHVKAAFPGQRVGVYTSGSDITAGHLPAGSDFLWFPAYPSGAMTYAQAEARTRPAPSGKQPLFWQFTSTPLDRSIAYLSPAALRTWAAGATTTPEDDMPLTDADVTKIWGHKAPSPTAAEGTDPARSMETYTRYADARHAQVTAQIGSLTGLVTALTAAVTAGGGLTEAQATAAAEAGAKAALDQLGHALGS